MFLHVILNAKNFYQRENNKSITISREMEDGKTLEKKRKLLISQKYFGRKYGMPGGKKENCLFFSKTY